MKVLKGRTYLNKNLELADIWLYQVVWKNSVESVIGMMADRETIS